MSTSNFTFGEDEEEYLLKREAIAEFDGGLTREDARKLAYICYGTSTGLSSRTTTHCPDLNAFLTDR